MIIKIILFAIIVICQLDISSVYAYIDPNTGGFFFQTVAPFVYGFLGVIVVFWKRITGYFKGLISRKKDNDSSSKHEH